MPGLSSPDIGQLGHGQLLGALDSSTVAVTTTDLDPGDAMLLYTDGFTEARTPSSRDDRYDEERLLAFADDLGRLLADLSNGVEDDVAVLAR